MIQATLFIELDINKCTEAFYSKYTKRIESLKELEKESWIKLVKSKKDSSKYLMSILQTNKVFIQKELNRYVKSLDINGVEITDFEAHSTIVINTKVNYKEFLKCDFMKENFDEKALASMRLVPFPETVGVPLGNKLQKQFYPEIYKVLKQNGVYGTIDHYELAKK